MVDELWLANGLHVLLTNLEGPFAFLWDVLARFGETAFVLVGVDDIRVTRRGWVDGDAVGEVWELLTETSATFGVVTMGITDFDTGGGVLLTVGNLGVWSFVALFKVVLVDQEIALVDWLAPWVLLVFGIFAEVWFTDGLTVLDNSQMDWDLTDGDGAVSSVVTVSDWLTVLINQVRWKVTLVGGSGWVNWGLAVGSLWADDDGGFGTGFVVEV